MFDFISKMIKGEPAFDAASDQPPEGQAQSAARSPSDPTRDERGRKIQPDVRITNLKTSRNGDKMEAYAFIRNNSSYDIETRGLRIMGQHTPLRVTVPARGASRGQVKLYSGAIARNEYDTHAYLDFLITSNGDYFQQEFEVEFDRQSDGTYLIEELHAENHVRDT